MHRIMKANILLISCCLLFLSASCQQRAATPTKGLKDYYKNYFTMGVAVSPRSLKTDEAELIVREFGSITAENAMKMGPIHPKENEYFWTHSDSIVAFAQRNNLRLRGHTLCWHNQTPAWMFVDAAGDTVSKEVLLKRLEDHITTVVSRYKGKIYAWDVVNEVISDKKDEYLRNSVWYKICGEDFIAKAFEFAHKADPKAILFYNDYNEISPVKRAKIIKLVQGLQEKGVPIHGIGLQAHWAVNEPSREQLDATLTEFAALNLNLQITELDISIYPKEHNARERIASDYDTAYTSDKEKQQVEAYAMCFELFRKHKKSITGITFWNVSDRYSWLDHFPVRDRKDYPLLFDKNLKPKKAYQKVVSF
jgi:endo-1,4-beta-xylanase